MLRIFILVILVIALSGGSALSQTGPIPVPLAKKDILNGDQTEKNSANLKKLSQELKSIESDMGEIKSEAGLKAKEVRDIEADIQTLNREITELDDDIGIVHEDLTLNRKELSAVIVSLYKMKSLPSEAMFLNPDAAEEAALSITTLKSMAPKLSTKLDELQLQLDNLKSLKSQKAELKKKRSARLKELSKARRVLENTLVRRNKDYEKTSETYARAKRESEEAAAAANNLKELVQNLAAKNQKLNVPPPPAPSDKGESESAALQSLAANRSFDRSTAIAAPSGLLLPANGLIAVGYGKKDHIGAKSQGIYIAGQPNAVVVTPAAGEIRYAGEFKNYGQMVIVEHKNNYYSLIAGLTKVDTVVGQNLSVGEPVGRSGGGGGNGESFVYYELRKNGRPVDPLKNLKNF